MGDGKKWAAEEGEESLRIRMANRGRVEEDSYRPVETIKNPPQQGVKHDKGKDRWELAMEMDSLEMVIKVLTYGANTKYSRGNYLNVVGWRWRYIGAAMRHIRAYLKARRLGIKELEYDPDTGYHHLAHGIASLMMCLDNELNSRPDGDLEPKKVDQEV